MKRILLPLVFAALAGCCSYSRLDRAVSGVKSDSGTPVASYSVVNISYKLLGIVPLTTGTTWKEGVYSDDIGGLAIFSDTCNLDDNLASVRHACKVAGARDVSNLVGRYDTYWAWSLCLVKKSVVKTSCLLVK